MLNRWAARVRVRWSAILVAALFLASGIARAADPTPDSRAEQITVQAKRRLLLKEKNSPSAVTELGHAQIAQEGVTGSTISLLRQAPSIYAYAQGPGENAPVFSIRGVRGLEVAETLDGVPMQDLLNGGRTGVIGNRFTLDQIDGVSIYPGVAYPDKNTFGTIGGTIAYASKQPGDEFSLDLYGSAGSFDTFEMGGELNSGRLDGPLGSGDNAPRVVLTYSNLQTGGYIQNTASRYNDLLFSAVKPYDDGLSKAQATVVYNTGNGAPISEPTPVPISDQFGRFSNFSDADVHQREQDQYVTVILRDETYVNDVINFGVSAFYLGSDQTSSAYENPDFLLSDAPQPLVNNPFNNQSTDQFGIGPGYYYAPGHLAYDPAMYYNQRRYCSAAAAAASNPAAIASGNSDSPCGLNSEVTFTHSDTYGIEPRASFILPFNTIKFGGLLAKETQPTPQSFIGGAPNVVPQPGYNQYQPNGYNGGSQRTIYQAFAQDKIDLLHDTLHLTPGVTIEGTYSSNHAADFLYVAGNANPNPSNPNQDSIGLVPSYKLHKWDRDALPFFNASYDLDRVLPAIAGATAYASFGESALFAPATDFLSNANNAVPSASIVHLYEVGAKYNTSNLLLSLDYFYQKVDRDFGFYEGSGPNGGANFFSNSGQREFKGLETAFTLQVSPDIQLFGNGSYTLAKYLKTDLAVSTIAEEQFGFAIKDSPISGVPAFVANLGVDYHHHSLLRDGDLFAARLDMQYTGRQYTTYDLPQTYNLPGYTTDEIAGATVTNPADKLSDFTIFNLLLSYTLPTPGLPLKHVKFDLNLQNLFDRRYYQYYYSQIPETNGTYTTAPYQDALPGEPFAVTFTTTARF